MGLPGSMQDALFPRKNVDRTDGLEGSPAFEHGDRLAAQFRPETQQCLRRKLRRVNAGKKIAAHARLVASQEPPADHVEAGGLRPPG